jgi:hypothetical protein
MHVFAQFAEIVQIANKMGLPKEKSRTPNK